MYVLSPLILKLILILIFILMVNIRKWDAVGVHFFHKKYSNITIRTNIHISIFFHKRERDRYI